LSFDVGAFSTVNQNEQRLQVSVTGPNNSTLLTPTTVSVFAPGNGTHYVGQTFTFVADGSTATIRFGDVSTTTTDVDLLLDNVQITNAAAPPAQPFTNGSFESGYTGWTETGNQSIENTSPYTAADGVNTVVFNAGQRQPNGVLSQTFSTSAGKTYSVSFALGAFSVMNQNPQAVSVSVTGINNGVLFAPQTFSVNAPGNGTTYVPQTFTFVANGSSATLTFTDVSSTTLNVDLLLDNVQVTVVSTP
jgi:membrane-bound inhibitor of C-type lysozyme